MDGEEAIGLLLSCSTGPYQTAGTTRGATSPLTAMRAPRRALIRNADENAFGIDSSPTWGIIPRSNRNDIGRTVDTPAVQFMPRRNFLALSALGGGLAGLGATVLVSAPPAGAAELDGRSLMEIYADQDARPDGKPVFMADARA